MAQVTPERRVVQVLLQLGFVLVFRVLRVELVELVELLVRQVTQVETAQTLVRGMVITALVELLARGGALEQVMVLVPKEVIIYVYVINML